MVTSQNYGITEQPLELLQVKVSTLGSKLRNASTPLDLYDLHDLTSLLVLSIPDFNRMIGFSSQVKLLWLPFELTDDSGKFEILVPLTPKENRTEWRLLTELQVKFSSADDSPNIVKSCDQLPIIAVLDALEMMNVYIPGRYKLLSYHRFSRKDEDKLLEFQSDMFDVVSISGRDDVYLHNEEHPQFLQTKRSIGENLILHLASLGPMDEAHSPILAKMRIVMDEMKKSFEMLRRTGLNINERICPNVFILLPKERARDISTWFQRMISVVENIKTIASGPTAAITNFIESFCQHAIELALVCETCRLPMNENKYPITEPAECIWKWLPMINTCLHIVCSINDAEKLGASFGIPSIEKEKTNSLKSIVKKISKHSFDDYGKLHEIVASLDPQRVVNNSREIEIGYSQREFERWLNKVDSEKHWGILSKIIDSTGNVVFACPLCCRKINALRSDV